MLTFGLSPVPFMRGLDTNNPADQEFHRLQAYLPAGCPQLDTSARRQYTLWGLRDRDPTLGDLSKTAQISEAARP
jgi:hypothetical protein